ncbi:MAG TPA: ATP-binding protein [Candidatus Methanomethylophilaceae archaeon]|nr:ATP-binding protein [Candidatus Methanomethylophilaceae archaeon]
MKVKSITVYGLLYDCDCNLDFSSGPLTFVYSRNGFGKTTVLRALVSTMKGEFDVLKNLPFKRMDINFTNDVNIIVENYEELKIQIQKNELEQPIGDAELRKLFQVTYIPPERQTVRRKDGHLVPAVIVYATELRDRIRYAKENSQLIKPEEEKRPDLSDGELVFLFKDLKAKLDFMKDAGLEPDTPSSLRFPPTHSDLAKKREEYQDLAYGLDDYIERTYPLSESVVVFKDILNEMFHRKTMIINEKDHLVFRLDNGEDLPLSALSSGERNVVIIMYRLLFQTAEGSIAVIDEPENSLHIEWQQKLSNTFLDIARLRNLQFIVATHSPQIIHDKWDVARELRDINAELTDTDGHCE